MATVLVVDDAKVTRLNVKNMLETLGHTVVGEAGNGFEAINQYKTLRPDFVIMGITMPMVRGTTIKGNRSGFHADTSPPKG